MPEIMLDTNTCIYVLKNDPPPIKRRFDRYAPGELAISALVAGELWHGVAKSQSRGRNEAALNQFLANLLILEWPARAARIYGELRASLERGGRVIGAMDMLIAAHALHENATLITNNLAKFERVEGLRVENWVKT